MLAKFDMFAVFDMLINSFLRFYDKVVNPLFEYFSVIPIATGLLFLSLTYRFLLSPWLSRAGSIDTSNTVERKEVKEFDFYGPSSVPRIETRGFTLK